MCHSDSGPSSHLAAACVVLVSLCHVVPLASGCLWPWEAFHFLGTCCTCVLPPHLWLVACSDRCPCDRKVEISASQPFRNSTRNSDSHYKRKPIFGNLNQQCDPCGATLRKFVPTHPRDLILFVSLFSPVSSGQSQQCVCLALSCIC